MEKKYSSSELKQRIDEVLNNDSGDMQLVKDNINVALEQVNIYHQELHYQNAELMRTVEQLEILKEKYQTLFSDAPIGYVVFDRNDHIHEANNTFCQMMDIPVTQAHHFKLTQFILPHFQDQFYFMKNHVLNEKKEEVLEMQMRARTRLYDVSIIAKPFIHKQTVDDEKEIDLICCAIMDITEMKQQQKRIIDMSYHDAMTGLYNRRFYAHITKELNDKSAMPITIATIDLDGLKIINDTLGHEYGDQAILSVTNILKENAQENFILIRMGGDEIIIVCPRTEKEDVSRYLSLCEKMIYTECVEGIPLSISYGIATKTKEKETITAIAALSEDIMYSRKILQSPKQKSYIVRKTITRLFEKHPKIKAHSCRVSTMNKEFAEYLELPINMIENAEKLGYLHDIGLIAISDPLIINDDNFNDEERQEYERHAQIGNRIIRSLFGYEDIATAVLYHHEHWDGSGYPYGLRGEDIPLLSKMIALIDRYDWHHYASGDLAHELEYAKAYELLKPFKGTTFDPALFEKFMSFLKQREADKKTVVQS